MVPDRGYNEAYISFIFTHPEWRGAGIATFMLYHLIQVSHFLSGSDTCSLVVLMSANLLFYKVWKNPTSVFYVSVFYMSVFIWVCFMWVCFMWVCLYECVLCDCVHVSVLYVSFHNHRHYFFFNVGPPPHFLCVLTQLCWHLRFYKCGCVVRIIFSFCFRADLQTVISCPTLILPYLHVTGILSMCVSREYILWSSLFGQMSLLVSCRINVPVSVL